MFIYISLTPGNGHMLLFFPDRSEMKMLLCMWSVKEWSVINIKFLDNKKTETIILRCENSSVSHIKYTQIKSSTLLLEI